MIKMRQSALIDVFTGWMNRRARDVADSMGNLSASRDNIAKVYETLSHQDGQKPSGIRGFFELAAHSWKSIKSSGGTTGRPYKPTFGFVGPAPQPR